MKKYILFSIIPSIIIVFLINTFVHNPSKDNDDYIHKAVASGNYWTAEKEYKNLIKSDFNNIEYHRGYIYCNHRTTRQNSSDSNKNTKENVINYYGFTKSNDPNVVDTAYYCLGYLRSVKKDYEGALNFYQKVQNKRLKFLNNSTGYCLKESGDIEKAKVYFQREIEIKGNIEGALNNYAEILILEKDSNELSLLLKNSEYKHLISPYIKKSYYFVTHNFTSYFLTIIQSYKESIIIDGLIAATLISIIWFLFIKRLDIFEPEKFHFLFITLLISIIISELSFLLYDFFKFNLNFDLKGSALQELFFCIFGIGFIEETVKIIPVFIMLFFTKQINESTDYLIYASISALGFAFMENLGKFHEFGLNSIGTRAVICVLLHMALSSIAIYGLVYSKYKKKSIIYFFLSFFLACVIHGFYDFFMLSSRLEGLIPLSFLFAILVFVIYRNMLSNVLNNSEFFKEISSSIRLNKNGLIIIYGLSYILVLQYLIIALRFGPLFANRDIGIGICFLVYMILIIYANFSKFSLKRNAWLPLLTLKEGKRKNIGRDINKSPPEQ